MRMDVSRNLIHRKAKTGWLPRFMEQVKCWRSGYWLINHARAVHNLIYIFIFLVLNIILLAQIGKCYDRYMRGPTYVDTKIVPQKKALFPAMTICAVKGGYKHDVLAVKSDSY